MHKPNPNYNKRLLTSSSSGLVLDTLVARKLCVTLVNPIDQIIYEMLMCECGGKSVCVCVGVGTVEPIDRNYSNLP